MDSSDQDIQALEEELKTLNERRKALLEKLISLKHNRIPPIKVPVIEDDRSISHEITNNSSSQLTIDLFRS